MTGIEIPVLAQQLGPVLAPYLPYLLKGVKKAGEAAAAMGKKIVEADWDKALRVWEKLRPHVEKQPDVQKRVEEAAEKVEDPRAEMLLTWELEKVLKAMPPQEVYEIQSMVQEAKSETRVVTASGTRSVAIGGDANRAKIDTGDKKN
jgi:ATP:corrinoid adenosyltransferase